MGAGEIDLPPEEMETSAAWMLLTLDTSCEVGLNDPRNAAGWSGLAYLLRHILPVYLGCAVSDVRSKAEVKSAEFDQPSPVWSSTPAFSKAPSTLPRPRCRS